MGFLGTSGHLDGLENKSGAEVRNKTGTKGPPAWPLDTLLEKSHNQRAVAATFTGLRRCAMRDFEVGQIVEQVCAKCDNKTFKVLAVVTELATLDTLAVECAECGEQIAFKRMRELN